MTQTPEQPNPNADSWLVHQWVVAGIVSAAGRFVPVPFVDDMVRSQCRKFVIKRTLAAHGRSELYLELEALYDDGGKKGVVAGSLRTMRRVATKLVLFPVRKLAAIATSARGVPLEIMRVVLIGRTLDRRLREGNFTAADAPRLRAAFEKAFAGMDLRVVRAAMKDALAGVSGLKSAAIKSARQVAGHPDDPEAVNQAEPTVQAGATQVQQALDRPEMLELFAEFDRRVDEALARA
jgi:hypothetical protein